VLFLFVITKHMGDISLGGRLQLKFFNVVSIGLPCLKMLLNTVSVALGANYWVE